MSRHRPPAGPAVGAAVLITLGALLMASCGPVVEIQPIGTVELPPPEQTSKVLAADGSVLAELHAEQDREIVPLDRVPAVLRDAVVAIEDARFYTHAGIDARAVGRALVANARERDIVEGGSTITQQLAKNAVVGDEVTVQRKLSEAAVALQLERQLTKDEILERYLNTVYFGNGAYGVQTAARRYFDVDVGDLRLEQAALLAGMLKAPAAYDPYRHPDAARRRRDVVLRVMAARDVVPAAQARAARDGDLGVVVPARGDDWRAPWFVDHVLDLLQHDPAFGVLGQDPAERAKALFRKGLRVETTLDRHWQRAAEAAVRATLTQRSDPRAALVAVDPATGSIRALVGGRRYDDPDDPTARFNLATDGRRQAGSTFKQLVLATALEQGHSLDEVFPAGRRVVIEPRPGEPEPYPVRNYDDRDYGHLSLRDATAHSVNVVYAQLAAEVGPEAIVETARAAGITTPLRPLRSLALGAQEVTPLEMASVQATLAAGGVHRPPTAVTRIVAADGTELYRRPTPTGRRVLDEAVAWLATSALREVVARGTGERADLGRPVAGKTGTTQNGADAWFVGYTPDLAAAVWLGFPEGLVAMDPPRTRIRVEGGNWPAEIFARFGLRALADVPAADFSRPDLDLVTVRVDATRNCLPNPYTPPDVIAERSYLDGTEPTELCAEPTGPPTTDVPDVVGLPVAQATRLLSEAGFTVRRRPEASQTLPPGYVIRQDPAAGAAQRLDEGYVVALWVSSSDRALAAVPDVVGLDVEEARARLEAAGFSVEAVQQCEDASETCAGAAQEPGVVWGQRPLAGERVAAHSTVRVLAYP